MALASLAACAAGGCGYVLGQKLLARICLWDSVRYGASRLTPLTSTNIFDLLDTFTSKVMLPLTGLGAIIFVAWCLDRDSVNQELGLTGGKEQLWSLAARYVAPIGVIAVFLAGLF